MQPLKLGEIKSLSCIAIVVKIICNGDFINIKPILDKMLKKDKKERLSIYHFIPLT